MRDRVALALPPLLLRLTLAVTFIWTGLAKVQDTMLVQGDDAAILANMGVLTPGAPGTPADPNAPLAPLPSADRGPATGEPGIDSVKPGDGLLIAAAFQGSPPHPDKAPPDVIPPQPSPLTGSPPPASVYSARDFPEPQPVRAMYGLALMLHKGGNPGVDADGTQKPPIWPPDLASGKRPVLFAYLVVIAELGGGIMLLLGLLTRLWAIVLCSVMLGALWLATIGPALQTSQTWSAFRSGHQIWDVHAWQTPLWNLALLAMAFSVFLTGAGAFALDNALFKRHRHEDHDDE